MCFKKWNEKIKNFSYCDIGCIKWGSMAFALAVVKGIDILWDWNLVEKVNIWWFVGIFVVLGIKPMIKFFKKSGSDVKLGRQENM